MGFYEKRCSFVPRALVCFSLIGSFHVLAEEPQHYVGTALKSTTISGFVDTSANWDVGDGAGPIPGRSFDGADKADGFNLNVVDVTLQGEADEQEGWKSGYKAELLFGPDANLYGTTSTGGGNNDSDFAIKQAYIETVAPVGKGLTVKLGVFDTLIGYEVFASRDNPNYSRAYSYFIQPFAQTGVLASYPLSDNVSLSLAVANTWNTIINARPTSLPERTSEDQKTYLGALTFTAPEDLGFMKGASLTMAFSDGLDSSESIADITSLYIGGSTPTPFEMLRLGFAFDYRRLTPSLSDDNQTAKDAALYVSVKATEKFSIHTRAEWAGGDAGSWGTIKTETGDDEEFLGLTLTGQYDHWSDVLSRVELRYDKDLGSGPDVFNNPPQDSSTSPDADNLSLTYNMVFSF
jgi:hypothetical protein